MTTKIKHLYLHVPFCKAICYYCDFAHRIYDEDLSEKWLQRLAREIKDNCTDQYETIYIGGGTPTSLSADQLDRLLSLLDPYSKETVEYTIEVNPESLDREKAEIFKRHGINRISMGVQSSDEQLLKDLNRKHTFTDVVKGVEMLKDLGFDNISADLMYSLPGQDMKSLQKSLSDIISLDIDHVSLYSLTIEENSVFGKKGVRPLDEELEADMYEYIERYMPANGFEHYEIANFCRKGKPSKHNLGYWNYDDFLGLSMGAAGKIGSFRYTNTRDLNTYLYGEDIRAEKVFLSPDDLKFENIMMSLRTSYGLDIKEFNRRYDTDFLSEYKPILDREPSLIVKDDRLICVNREILNTVLLDFLP